MRDEAVLYIIHVLGAFADPLYDGLPNQEVSMPSILIIEDTDDLRGMIRDFVTRLSYEVYEASDGLQGIKMAQSLRPSLILLDLMMPTASGDLTLGFIRSTPQLKNTPVIVISAHPNATNIASDLGANACLLKPFSIRELKDLISQLAPIS